MPADGAGGLPVIVADPVAEDWHQAEAEALQPGVEEEEEDAGPGDQVVVAQ